jgi:radical SAM superfamily enzyme YgiQ (UPF0313 family)
LFRLIRSGADYDYPPYRPPSEAESLLVRVTRGCPWNQCTFCSMYKDVRFEKRPLEEVFQDIETAHRVYGSRPRTIFIGDSNSLVLDPRLLAEILRKLYRHFPSVERVTSYARARTLCDKSIDDLRLIREAGLTRLHIGLESGDPQLLKEIRKGASPEQMVKGAVRAKEAGFEVSLYVLAGIGGQTYWRQHAEGSADVLNQVDPHFIRIRTYVPIPRTPLWNKIREGAFEVASPEIILREQRHLIQRLEVSSQYLSDHISNYAPVYGILPGDRTEMLQTIESALETLKKDPSYRNSLEQKGHLTRL